MHLELTREQYRDLLDLVYLGNWMVNAIREPGQEVKKYRDLEQYILSFAEEQGFGDVVEYNEKFQQYFHTRDFEESEADTYRQEYDEENFWEELTARLARRDLLRQYGEENVRGFLGTPAIFEKEYPFEERYAKEFEDHGLERVEIVEREGKTERSTE